MIITREVDYALRILRALSDGEQMTTGTLCEREKIPKQFAYKIIRKLSAGNFLTTDRGAVGGVRLTANLREKSLYELMCALDARELVNACMQDGYTCEWRECQKVCGAHKQFEELQQTIDSELKKRKLYSLLSMPKET